MDAPARTHPGEVVSLTLTDLNVEELERRLELAVATLAAQSCSVFSDCYCQRLASCGVFCD
jgi:hypothetical protein